MHPVKNLATNFKAEKRAFSGHFLGTRVIRTVFYIMVNFFKPGNSPYFH